MSCSGCGKKGSSRGTFNNTTVVVMVDSPPLGKIRIIDIGDIQIYNRDTLSTVITLSINGISFDAPSIITAENWVNDAKITLRHEEKLSGVLAVPVDTNQPNYFVSFEDY